MRNRTTTIVAGTAGAIAVAFMTSWMPVAAQGIAAQQPGTSVTVTGCLQRPQSAGSTAGTPTGAPASPSQSDYRANSSVPDPGYILAGAVAKAGNGAANADAPTGTSGTRTESTQPMTYALIGEESTLAPHVGHTVEITGVVAPPVAAKAPTNTPDPAASATVNAPAADAAGRAFQTGVRQLRVTTIKMTANNCAQRP